MIVFLIPGIVYNGWVGRSTVKYPDLIVPFMAVFQYGEEELSFLRSRDPIISELIDRVGFVEQQMDPCLFVSLTRNIIGQQISIPMYERIWAKMRSIYGDVPDPVAVVEGGVGELRNLGITSRKSEYILGIAVGIIDGTIDEEGIGSLPDREMQRTLERIRGVGPWTAEMAMIFYYGRKDVFSFGDLALVRGIRRTYGTEKVDRGYFEDLRKRFSPYCTIASFYLWEVGEGRVPGFGNGKL